MSTFSNLVAKYRHSEPRLVHYPVYLFMGDEIKVGGQWREFRRIAGRFSNEAQLLHHLEIEAASSSASKQLPL